MALLTSNIHFCTLTKTINLNNHSGLQAHIAFAIMNRNNITTFGAPMFLFLAFKKLFHALPPYFS